MVFFLIVISLIIPPNLDLSSLGTGNVSSQEEGGQVQVQGKFEIEPGEPHAPYNSFPPTSGWYYPVDTGDIVWGARDEPIVEEVQVSYLVRGAVLVQYNCAIECPNLVRNLERVVDKYPEAVILAPYENMASTVALTAWGWQDNFAENEFSEATGQRLHSDAHRPGARRLPIGSTMFLARVYVTLKPTVNDPQGKTILGGLKTLGFDLATDVRAGKYLEIRLDSRDRAQVGAAGGGDVRQAAGQPRH